MTDDREFIPRDKLTIHLDKGEFIPFKQSISRDASLKKPFIPFTVADALDRQKKKDK
jgi:hypothetical protein